MSSIALSKLVFDPAAAAETANVGAYLRASDGTLLTHTDVGGKKALDVRLAEGVNVEVDLAHTDDSVRLGDGTAFFTSTSENSDIALDVHISNTSILVTASDLDIRNLTNVDVVTAEQGTSPWVVSATNLDIRDLTHVSDSIKIGDGTDLLAVNTDGSINTKPAGASTAAYAAVSITTTATDIVGTDLANRIQILVQNNSTSKDVFVGSNASVTVANGIKLSPGASIVLDAGAGINLHGITASGTADVRYLELAA